MASGVWLVSGQWTAGAGRTELTPPAGTPLGAYNWGPRKVPHWPIPEFRAYSTFLVGNQGVLNPTYARALVLDDGQGETVCFVTFDLMAVDEPMTYLAWLMAAAKGFPVPFEKTTFTGSHTHSGFAGWMSQFGIQITPTMYISLSLSSSSSFKPVF
ncbi:MAG: hypothetical protein Q8P67_06895 [archaeon]|nr:hypothetical protein [archaeon]